MAIRGIGLLGRAVRCPASASRQRVEFQDRGAFLRTEVVLTISHHSSASQTGQTGRLPVEPVSNGHEEIIAGGCDYI